MFKFLTGVATNSHLTSFIFAVKKMLRVVRVVVPRVPALVHGTHMSTVPRVCIVGSGPAGFYTAQQILKVSVPYLRQQLSGQDNSVANDSYCPVVVLF